MRTSFLIIILFALASCNSGRGIGQYESPAWHMSASLEERTKYFKEQCLGFGFKDNTTAMSKCIQTQMNESRSGARSKMRDASRNYRSSYSSSSSSMSCISNSVGSSTYTNCF